MSNILLSFNRVLSAAPGIEESPRIARIVIDRATRSNALDRPMLDDLLRAIKAASSEPDVRALVLTGAGSRAFIGGADIDTMSVLDAASAREFINALHLCCDALRCCPVPVIARINGVAFGAGLELAACADLRVAALHCRFGMPEVRLGIPSVIEAALLPDLVGVARSRELLLLGDIIDCETAAQWGLVHRAVVAEKLDHAVDQMIESLLQNGPIAVRAQKALMAQWESQPIDQAVAAGIDAFERSWQTDEPVRMMNAWKDRKRH